jgi:hypothetical protein
MPEYSDDLVARLGFELLRRRAGANKKQERLGSDGLVLLGEQINRCESGDEKNTLRKQRVNLLSLRVREWFSGVEDDIPKSLFGDELKCHIENIEHRYEQMGVDPLAAIKRFDAYVQRGGKITLGNVRAYSHKLDATVQWLESEVDRLLESVKKLDEPMAEALKSCGAMLINLNERIDCYAEGLARVQATQQARMAAEASFEKGVKCLAGSSAMHAAKYREIEFEKGVKLLATGCAKFSPETHLGAEQAGAAYNARRLH